MAIAIAIAIAAPTRSILVSITSDGRLGKFSTTYITQQRVGCLQGCWQACPQCGIYQCLSEVANKPDGIEKVSVLERQRYTQLVHTVHTEHTVHTTTTTTTTTASCIHAYLEEILEHERWTVCM